MNKIVIVKLKDIDSKEFFNLESKQYESIESLTRSEMWIKVIDNNRKFFDERHFVEGIQSIKETDQFIGSPALELNNV